MMDTGKRAATDPKDPPLPVSKRAAESRHDPLTGVWTIFAPHRERRPDEFVSEKESVNPRVRCPFCPGNELETPPPVWIGQISDDDSSTDILRRQECQSSNGQWSVRVVPNKFPAVEPIQLHGNTSHVSPLFQWSPIRGGHEVVIESRNHVQSLSELDVAELLLVFRAYRDRLRYWRNVAGVAYVAAFKNVGARAGASLRHTHSQLIATDAIPATVMATLQRMARYRASSGCCLQCDLIRAELKAKQRIIWRDDSLVAYCPFASRLPMLARITTHRHQPCYEDLDDDTIESVSRLVGRVVSWLEQVRPGTAYNFCLHSRPPAADEQHDAFHWSIEIFPRMTQIAGFELSSDCMINPVLPEAAAAKYRSRARTEDPRLML